MSTPTHSVTSKISAKVYSKGKLNISSTIRHGLHLNDGTEVLFIKHGQSWAFSTREKLFKDAQAYFKSINPKHKLMVDEFIAERHKLAINEAE
jgi:hypothetical protein